MEVTKRQMKGRQEEREFGMRLEEELREEVCWCGILIKKGKNSPSKNGKENRVHSF